MTLFLFCPKLKCLSLKKNNAPFKGDASAAHVTDKGAVDGSHLKFDLDDSVCVLYESSSGKLLLAPHHVTTLVSVETAQMAFERLLYLD